MALDKDTLERAKVIAITTEQGHKLALTAGRDASDGMSKFVKTVKTEEARVLALEAHAQYMGIAMGLFESLSPIVNKMPKELEAEGCDSDEAVMLTRIYASKIVKNIVEALGE